MSVYPVSYPAAPSTALATAGYQSGYARTTKQQRRAAFYSDPGRVQQYVGGLRKAIDNLADQKSGSILKNDCYDAVKRVFSISIPTSPELQVLHGNWQAAQVARQAEAAGQKVNKAELHGSPQYTWFINATATCIVNAIINEHAQEIFLHNYPKVDMEARKNGIDYIKRRYARVISKWYMFYRPTQLQFFYSVPLDKIISTPGVVDAYNLAVAALGHKSVRQYLKSIGKEDEKVKVPMTPGTGGIGSTPARLGRTGQITVAAPPLSTILATPLISHDAPATPGYQSVPN